MDHRSTLGNIFNIIGGLPQGHDKPLKHAVYNAVALFLLVLCCCAGWGLYIILGPFIKPLIWALLVGSVLHPLKYYLALCFQSWFETLEESRTPIVISIFIIPFTIVNDVSEFIGSKLLKYLKVIIAVTVAVPVLHVIYNYTPRVFICIIWKLAMYTHALINYFLNNASVTFVIFILVGYISLILLIWKPENNKRFHYGSTGIWLLLSCAVAHQFGAYQILVFLILQVIFVAGFISEISNIREEMREIGQHITLKESITWAFKGKILLDDESKHIESEQEQEEILDPSSEKELLAQEPEQIIKQEVNKTQKTHIKKDPWALELFEENLSDKSHQKDNSDSKNLNSSSANDIEIRETEEPGNKPVAYVKKVPKKLKRSYSQPYFCLYSRPGTLALKTKPTLNEETVCSTNYGSDFYMYTLLWACGIMLLWKNIMLLPILPLPILVYVIKHLGIYLGLWNWLFAYWNKVLDLIGNWCCERYDAFIPVPIRGLFRVIYKVNVSVKKNVRDSIDTMASSVIIILLIIFVTCASVFIVFQIYAEAIMLIQMTSNVINQTVVHNPELRQLLPPAWDDTVDSILDNAYLYGREGISKAVRSMMSNVDSEKVSKLENQVLELWDRLYQSWMSSDVTHGPKVTVGAVQNTWNVFIDDIQKSPEMFNFNSLIDFAKQNVGTLMSLLESVWSILKGNISLVLGSFSTFLSVLLGGGTAVLNFILNVFVFLTTLFYLLNSSGKLYKPVELMTNFSSSGSRFGLALEGAVNGVFTASFKMAAFYGLWTWLIHNLFSVKIVYLPSAVAAILGAVPFLGTYWACVPAVLDLWLAQDKGFKAILFAAFQFLPTSVIDSTIYKEIRGGGHPYLTGLAIAGGIFCLGVEGAIIGPLLLCGLYVAIDLSSSLFKDSPSEELLNLPSL